MINNVGVILKALDMIWLGDDILATWLIIDMFFEVPATNEDSSFYLLEAFLYTNEKLRYE